MQKVKAADMEKSLSDKEEGQALRTPASFLFFARCQHFQKSENAMSIALYFLLFSVSFLYHYIVIFFLWIFIEGKNRTHCRTKEESVNWNETERIFITSFALVFHSDVSLWSVSECFQRDRKGFPHVLFRFFP